MSRRSIGIGLGVAALLLVIFVSPVLLRYMSFFQVRQVQLVGVRFHSSDRLIRALDLAHDRNLFESLGDVESRAMALSGVEWAKAKRRLPGTLTIVVEEVVPIAFVSTSTGLLSLDAAGRPLTYDAVATGLDLPIVERADSALARVLATIRFADSSLFQQVDAARFGVESGLNGGEEFVIIEIGQTDVILRREPTEDEIRAVGMVRRHLASTDQPYDELDVRFDGRVIVRRSGA